MKLIWMTGVALVVILQAGTVHAGPADYIYTPKVERGEWELDVKYGSNRSGDPAGRNDISAGIGYGVSEYWFTALNIKHESALQGLTLAEWENKFAMGDMAGIAAGFLLELETPVRGSGPSEVRMGPLLEKRYEQLQLNGNVLFERAFGKPDEQGVPYVTNIGYQWQGLYHLRSTFGLGLQGMGEMGQWNRWDTRALQNHRSGPVITAFLPSVGEHGLKLNMGLLFGVSRAAPARTYRIQLECEL